MVKRLKEVKVIREQEDKEFEMLKDQMQNSMKKSNPDFKKEKEEFIKNLTKEI